MKLTFQTTLISLISFGLVSQSNIPSIETLSWRYIWSVCVCARRGGGGPLRVALYPPHLVRPCFPLTWSALRVALYPAKSMKCIDRRWGQDNVIHFTCHHASHWAYCIIYLVHRPLQVFCSCYNQTKWDVGKMAGQIGGACASQGMPLMSALTYTPCTHQMH